MLVIPAIDIRQGRCVRLTQGQESQETVYWKDPVEMAITWHSRGAKMLHVADLDGAFQGRPVNLDKVAKMKKAIPIPIELGGGYRTMQSIDEAMEAGIDRLILGTVAVYQPDLVAAAVVKYCDRIAVSVDVTNDFVAVEGWKEISAVRFETMVRKLREIGVVHLLYTDTRKDGTLTGPNIAGIRLFLAAAEGSPVTVSGGITTVEDIVSLRDLEPLGLNAVVIGKALYDRKITLEQAIRAGGN